MDFIFLPFRLSRLPCLFCTPKHKGDRDSNHISSHSSPVVSTREGKNSLFHANHILRFFFLFLQHADQIILYYFYQVMFTNLLYSSVFITFRIYLIFIFYMGFVLFLLFFFSSLFSICCFYIIFFFIETVFNCKMTRKYNYINRWKRNATTKLCVFWLCCDYFNKFYLEHFHFWHGIVERLGEKNKINKFDALKKP